MDKKSWQSMLTMSKILLQDRRILIFGFLNVFVMVLFIQMVTTYSMFLLRYYLLIYIIIVLPSVLLIQNINYKNLVRDDVLLRRSSACEVLKMIVKSDLLLTVFYWSISCGTYILITLGFPEMQVIEHINIMASMLLWGIFYTIAKHIVHSQFHNYAAVNCCIIAVIVLSRVLGPYIFTVYLSSLSEILAVLLSVMGFIYLFVYNKKFTFE